MNYGTTKLVLPTNYEMINDMDAKRISGGNCLIINYVIPPLFNLIGNMRYKRNLIFQDMCKGHSNDFIRPFEKLIYRCINEAINNNSDRINKKIFF